MSSTTRKRKLPETEESNEISPKIPKKRPSRKAAEPKEKKARAAKEPKEKKVLKRTVAKKSKSEAIEKKTKEPKTVLKRNQNEDYEDDDGMVEYEDKDIVSTYGVWDEADMLSTSEKVSKHLASKFIDLLTQGCTIPFIARYRKEVVDLLTPDRLQDLYESYQNVQAFKKKVKSIMETLRKSKKLTPAVEQSILNAKNLSELDLVYAPLKSHSTSLAERARSLGLEQHAVNALSGHFVDINAICNDSEELATFDKVESHITHIVADIIYKDSRVMEHMRSLKEETRFILQSSRTKNSSKAKEKQGDVKYSRKSDPETYKVYFDWKCPVQFVKCYQTLAVNRGEDEKILTVKVVVPDWFYNKLERFCLTLWKSSHWVHKGLMDAYNRLIKPWLSRQVRSDLTHAAQKEAVKTFIANLEKYLLTEPIKNRKIAGLDPGFKAGCKVGIINENGDKLEAVTIYPKLNSNNIHDIAAKQLKELLQTHNVEVIGLGNGTACRETETWLKCHDISANIPVIIVPEQGASIYSVSKEAQKEHPNMDPNLISALSIARRVLDPLGELIKVEPKNLGVGLYQHDIPGKMLETALDSAVETVVSLVGVDLNTASQAMLSSAPVRIRGGSLVNNVNNSRRISGLNEGRAAKIIAYRQQRRFTSRAELLKVGGIGKVTYQQCVGFLRVDGPEVLDNTVVHPESYAVATSFAKKIGVNIKELTQPHFPSLVESKTMNLNYGNLSKDLDTDVCTLELIVSAFKQQREDKLITFCRPIYSVAVQATNQLKEGMSLTGVVRNVVPFGCFVDCGVGENGLIHRSHAHAHGRAPQLGDRVAVTVLASPKPRKIQLRLDAILD